MEIHWVNGQYREDDRIFNSQFEVEGDIVKRTLHSLTERFNENNNYIQI